jgi:hypothetical protein
LSDQNNQPARKSNPAWGCLVGLGIAISPVLFAIIGGSISEDTTSGTAIWFVFYTAPLGAIVGIAWLVIGLIRNSKR